MVVVLCSFAKRFCWRLSESFSFLCFSYLFYGGYLFVIVVVVFFLFSYLFFFSPFFFSPQFVF